MPVYKACVDNGWQAVEVFSRRRGGFVPGWAIENGRRSMSVYVLEGKVHKKHLRVGSWRLRGWQGQPAPVVVPDSEEEDDFYLRTRRSDEMAAWLGRRRAISRE